VRYGGNTACVEVLTREGSHLILDAGTGIRRLGASMNGDQRIDILLSHLHTDHIQGLGFFAPLFQAGREVHIWGPRSPAADLRARLTRYLSAPLFPVHLRELPSRLTLHDVPMDGFEIAGVKVRAGLVLHPGLAVGYRLAADGFELAYLSDHEPALGRMTLPESNAWTSGFSLADGVDALIHDSQYTEEEYGLRRGWGHSTISHAVEFARRSGTRKLVTFHHDPDHSDAMLDRMHEDVLQGGSVGFDLIPGCEGLSFEIA
jgi:phosphoribosyl 1,2-cyclic phosphodiesterase